MYAVVGVWTMDDNHRDEQDRGLLTQVIPSVRTYPGFVRGYWMRDPETGKAHTTIVLDDAETAQAFKRLVQSNRQAHAQVGITNDTLTVVEVTATA